MAIALETAASDPSGDSSGAKSVNLGTISADDFIVLAYRREGTSATFTWPSGFTERINRPAIIDGFDEVVLGVATKVADGTEGSTFDVTADSGAVFNDALSGTRWSGVNTTDPLDSATPVSVDGQFNPPQAPSITSNTDDAVHVAMVAVWGNDSGGTPTGYTNAVQLDNDDRMAIAYKTVATAGASGAAAWTGSNVHAGGSIVLKPGGGTPTVALPTLGNVATLHPLAVSGGATITDDIGIQRGTTTVPAAGTTVSITAVSSLDNAFVLLTNNRHTGVGSSTGNSEADDVSAGARLTATGTITFNSVTGSADSDTAWEVWEYLGDPGGDNEFIVRSVDQVTISSGATGTATVSDIDTVGNVVPFITGVTSTTTSNGSNDMTVTAEISGSTLTVTRGGTGGTTVVNVASVEFTGSNWTVSKGALSGQTADSGTITLGTDIVDWGKAAIVSWGHAGDNTNEAIADNWPTLEPGANTTSVDYSFDGNHDGTDDDFVVYALYHPDLAVTRFDANTSSAVSANVDVTSAGLTDLERSSVLGTSESSGSGTAYARGWRNYRLTSLTNVEHSCSRTGNNLQHRIQVIDWSAITSSGGGATTVEVPHLTAASLAAPSVSPGAVSVDLPSLSSTVTLHEPSVSPAAVSVGLPSLGSMASLLAPSVSPGAVSVDLPTLNPASLHTPTLNPGAVTVQLPHIAAVTLHTPAVATGAAGVSLPHLTAASLHTPAISPGAVTLTLPSLDAATVFAPVVSQGAVSVSLPAFTAAALHAPTVAAGAVTIGLPSIDAATLHVPTVSQGAVVVSLPTLTAASVHAPSVAAGSVDVALPHFAAATLHAPIVSTGATVIALPALTAAALHAPTVSAGSIEVELPTLGNIASVHAPTVSVGASTVALPHLTPTSLHTPQVAAGAVVVALPSLGGQVGLHTPSVAPGVVLVDLPTLTAGTLHTPTITPGVVIVELPSLDAVTLHVPTIVNLSVIAGLVAVTIAWREPGAISFAEPGAIAWREPTPTTYAEPDAIGWREPPTIEGTST